MVTAPRNRHTHTEVWRTGHLKVQGGLTVASPSPRIHVGTVPGWEGQGPQSIRFPWAGSAVSQELSLLGAV